MNPYSNHVTRVKDYELAYLLAGEGPPVILMHPGGATDYRTWEAQIGPFSRHFKVIAYSRRGHYPNLKQSLDPSLNSTSSHASDLAEIITGLNLGTVNLVASSYGADIALWLAVKTPGVVKSLVLVEPALHPWLIALPGGTDLYRKYKEPMDAATSAVHDGDVQRAARIFIEAASGPGEYDRLSDTSRKRLLDNIELLGRWEVDAYDPNSTITREDAAKISHSVLLVSGLNTTMKYKVINEELYRLLPLAKLAFIPDAAHLPHLQNPVIFNKSVIDFLRFVDNTANL